MSEELRSYLAKSKEKRTKITSAAKTFEGILKANSILDPDKNFEYPNLTPLRFKEYKENLMKNIQKIFSPKASSIINEGTRSKSLKKSIIESVYLLRKPLAKHMTILPPIIRKSDKSIIERVLKGKTLIESLESTTGSQTNKTPRKALDSRFEVKKQLLIPVRMKFTNPLIIKERNFI